MNIETYNRANGTALFMTYIIQLQKNSMYCTEHDGVHE